MEFLVANYLLPLVAVATVAAQQQAAVVHGRAVDRDGKPVAGCAVGVFNEPFDTAALLATPMTTTDVAGCYRIEAGQSGSQSVVVTKKGCQVCVMPLDGAAAAERGMLDALMLPGGTLSGRVRDAAGKPIAGALVRVDDPLSMATFREQPRISFQSRARTDERGIFEVPGVPRTGLRVTASAAGHAGVCRLAAHDSPLDLTLTATGLVRGRVVDSGGTPVPGLAVALVTLERRDGDERLLTDGEGRFTITVPNAFAFRVTAHDSRPPHRSFSSGLLRGPADDVDVKQVDLRRDVRQITVRCVDAATKAPIDDFHASTTAGARENVAEALLQHAEGRRPFRGQATFDVAASQRGRAMVVVDAKGHGYATVAVPEDPREALIAELPAESVLVGCVIDPQTGQPAVGCAVRALPDVRWHHFGDAPDPWRFGAITDDEGRYRIGGLAAGDYAVQAYAVDRPSSLSTPVTIAAGAQATLDVELEAPRFLEIELVGEIPPSSLGAIWFDAFAHSDDKQRGTTIHRWLPLPPSMPLSGPRKQKFGPIDDRRFRAKLLLPTRDRLGSALTIDLADVGNTARTKLQLPDLRSELHRGRVRLPADVSPERVAVLATRRFEAGEGDSWSRSLSSRDRPFAVCLGSDTSFAIDVPRGRYVLQLVDLETGIVFHTDDAERTLDATTAREAIEIAPAIRWLTIDFVPSAGDGPIVVQGIIVDAARPGDGLGAFVGLAGGNDNRQTRLVPCRPATSQLRWLVPARQMGLDVIQSFRLLSPASTSSPRVVVAQEGVDASSVEPRVTFRIPPPPDDAAIVAPAAK